MRPLLGHAILASGFIVVGSVAACGGGDQGPAPQTPSTSTPSASTAVPTAPTASATPPSPSGSASGATAPTTAPSKGDMKAIGASTMAADLKALGFELNKLPALNKMEPDKLRQVMKTFTKALGTQCTGCHDANDFRAATPKKKIASKMWDDFVRALSMQDGSPLYCDSCHGGHMEFLDRHDKKALGVWMDANYVSKLKRADKKDHGCDTCHGDPFEPKFLAAWTK